MQAYEYHQDLYMPLPPAASSQFRPGERAFNAPPPSSYGVRHADASPYERMATSDIPKSDLNRQFASLTVNGRAANRDTTASSTFRWRLDAPEFVPQSMRRVPVNRSTADQNGLYEGGESNGALVGAGQQQQQQTQNDQLQCFLWELVNWLSHLYMEPAKFDVIAHQICSQMNYTVHCERDMQAVMDKFFEVAMSYPHFSYHAARLCVSFNGRYSGCAEQPMLFRKVLLRRCSQMVDARFALMDNASTVGQLHNFLVFMAELCVQLLDRGRPVEFVTDALFQLIGDLLLRASSSEANVRCCVSALKCCGSFLQHSCPEQLQKIFDLLQGDVLPSCAPNLVAAIESLQELRSKWQKSSLELSKQAEADNWAKNIAESAANSVLDQSDAAPVFYGPDGVPLTQEETAFLAELEQGSCDEDSAPANDVLSEDDLIAEAYEEFLEMKKNGQR